MSYSSKFFFSLFFALVSVGLTAQSLALAQLTAVPIYAPVSNEVAEAPVTAASFPGGKRAFAHGLALHLTYPDLAREYAVEGTVIVRVQLDENGVIAEQKVIRGLGFGCDEAALEALNKLPRWNAARRGNKRVSGLVYVPIRFQLR